VLPLVLALLAAFRWGAIRVSRQERRGPLASQHLAKYLDIEIL
jgi:hypothetical protein